MSDVKEDRGAGAPGAGAARTTLTFAEATSIVAGYGIGGGVLAVPYLAAKTGLWAALGAFALAYAASLVLHLMIAELCAGDGRGSQIVELFRRYFFVGKLGAVFTWLFFGALALVFLASLAAYVAGGSETLEQGLGLRAPWGGLLFYVAAAAVAAFGLKVLGVAEKLAIGAMIALFAALAIATAFHAARGGSGGAWAQAAARPFSGAGSLALFGMLMFCFSAFFSVPQVVAGLGGEGRAIRRSVAAGLAVNGAIIALVTILAFSSSAQVTQIATVGWSRALGPWASLVGTAFVLLAMLTSYWSISFALSSMLQERLGIGRMPAWLAATLPTLGMALVGMGGFLDFMRTAGGGIAVLIAVLFVPTYGNYRRRARRAALMPAALDRRAWGWAVALCYLAMAAGSLVSVA